MRTRTVKMKNFIQFIKSKSFWKNILYIILVGLLLLFLVNLWLKQYTHHGQKLELPSFIDLSISEAQQLATENKFELIVVDSVHIVGKHGSLVLNQNPETGFYAKEGRKVYVTVTKHNPELVSIKSLPVLYGKNYDRKKRELLIGHKINSKVVGSMYDIGPEGHIMMVIYDNDTIITRKKRVQNLDIPKGGSLKFILSKRSGGFVEIPDLTCQTYDAAKFLLNSFKLNAGKANADATVEDFSEAYVTKQIPEYVSGEKVRIGTEFTLFLTQDLPPDCN